MVVALVPIWGFVHASKVELSVLRWAVSTCLQEPRMSQVWALHSVPSKVLTQQQALKPPTWLSNKDPSSSPASTPTPWVTLRGYLNSLGLSDAGGSFRPREARNLWRDIEKLQDSCWQNWKKSVVLKPCSPSSPSSQGFRTSCLLITDHLSVIVTL